MVSIIPSQSQHSFAIEQLLDHAFGDNRQAKTSYRFRDGVAPIGSLARVAVNGEALVGSIQYWPARLGRETVLLLGPIAIWAGWKDQGIGAALMATSMAAALAEGWSHVFLVGDLPYYSRFGFGPTAQWAISMEDEQQHRLLGRCLGGAATPSPGVLQPMRVNKAATSRVLAIPK